MWLRGFRGLGGAERGGTDRRRYGRGRPVAVASVALPLEFAVHQRRDIARQDRSQLQVGTLRFQQEPGNQLALGKRKEPWSPLKSRAHSLTHPRLWKKDLWPMIPQPPNPPTLLTPLNPANRSSARSFGSRSWTTCESSARLPRDQFCHGCHEHGWAS